MGAHQDQYVEALLYSAEETYLCTAYLEDSLFGLERWLQIQKLKWILHMRESWGPNRDITTINCRLVRCKNMWHMIAKWPTRTSFYQKLNQDKRYPLKDGQWLLFRKWLCTLTQYWKGTYGISSFLLKGCNKLKRSTSYHTWIPRLYNTGIGSNKVLLRWCGFDLAKKRKGGNIKMMHSWNESKIEWKMGTQ